MRAFIREERFNARSATRESRNPECACALKYLPFCAKTDEFAFRDPLTRCDYARSLAKATFEIREIRPLPRVAHIEIPN